jgi:hypothetical protein
MVASQKEHTFCTILTLIKCKTCHLCQNKAWNSSCKCCLPWQDAHVCQVCAHYHLSMLLFYTWENVLICPRRVLCRTHDVKYNLQPLVMAMKEKNSWIWIELMSDSLACSLPDLLDPTDELSSRVKVSLSYASEYATTHLIQEKKVVCNSSMKGWKRRGVIILAWQACSSS